MRALQTLVENVKGTGLLNLRIRKGTQGSNPCPSVLTYKKSNTSEHIPASTHQGSASRLFHDFIKNTVKSTPHCRGSVEVALHIFGKLSPLSGICRRVGFFIIPTTPTAHMRCSDRGHGAAGVYFALNCNTFRQINNRGSATTGTARNRKYSVLLGSLVVFWLSFFVTIGNWPVSHGAGRAFFMSGQPTEQRVAP